MIFILKTIIEEVYNKWKRRLTTSQRRKEILVEQITVLTKHHKEKENLIGRGVINGTIPSAVSNNAATSGCAPTNSPLRKMGIKSNKAFMVVKVDVSPES